MNSQVHWLGCDPLVDFYNLRSSFRLADYWPFAKVPQGSGEGKVGKSRWWLRPSPLLVLPSPHLQLPGLPHVSCPEVTESRCWIGAEVPSPVVVHWAQYPFAAAHAWSLRLTWAPRGETPYDIDGTVIRKFLLVLSSLGSFLAHKESLWLDYDPGPVYLPSWDL